MKYDFRKIEPKWQKVWEKSKIYEAEDPSEDSGRALSPKKKWYSLIEFPYPSGAGIHMGHIRSNTAMDIISRKRRMEGYNVLYPNGWDAFGLPTENYAIKTGISPQVATKQNTDTFRRQLKSLGFSFDWSREINTSDPNYYKWTQWMFLKFFEKGLAYKAEMAINWCPKDKIGLANEEVVGGKCERCGTAVIKKNKAQWMIKITAYADKLLEGLKDLDFLPEIKTQQENWIGRSEGAEIDFVLKPEAEPTFYQFFEPGMIKDGEPFVEREAILAIVKHWSEDKYLGLKWKKVNWETFITGGVEKGQSAEQAALAEIIEETGYKNLKLVKKLGRMHSKFFHVPKNHNRFGHFSVFYFELKNGDRDPMSDEEKSNHELIWLTKSQIDSFGLPSSHRYVWELLQNGGKELAKKLKVFTTRPDTLFGATYLVLSPEHTLVSYFIHQASNAKEIDSYVKMAAKKTEIERTTEEKDASTGSAVAKTGVELKGVKAINPATKEKISIWISDYVLATYGTGAIMAVPAHDERDFEFAKKFKLSIKEVIIPSIIDRKNPPVPGKRSVERKNVHAIVRDPSTGKYLAMKWTKFNWVTFPMGGVEDGEDIVAAAIREVKEETGFTNLKLVRVLEGQVRAEYFAAHKDENRVALTRAVVFELVDHETIEIKKEEKAAHDVVWLDESKLNYEYMTHAEIDIWNQKLRSKNCVYVDEGILIDSGKFDGMKSDEAKKKITEFVHGQMTVKYKLRDWVFSRQRYWGEPIPIISCEKCGFQSVPEKDLPVKLPPVKNYQPRDDGESPLASVSKWVNVKCPKCKGSAKRETDTMPNWAGSSWYFLRYIDSKNKKAFADAKKLKYFMPVDWYNGGMEHVTLHLLYSRFWNRFLFDLGLVPAAEPYKKRTAHGIILAEGGVKMSKSKGNVVNPDPIVKEFGADALRLYEMFMGPFNQSIAWDKRGILGTSRFLERVWKLYDSPQVSSGISSKEIQKLLHKTIKKVTEDIESMSFNTAISAMMIFTNEAEKQASAFVSKDRELFLKILAPFAPHIAEELWALLELGIVNKESGKKKITKKRNSKFEIPNSIHAQPWPEFDPKLIEDETFMLVVQINGKVRDSFEVPKNITQAEVEKLTLAREGVKKHISTKPKRVIYVPGRLINIVL